MWWRWTSGPVPSRRLAAALALAAVIASAGAAAPSPPGSASVPAANPDPARNGASLSAILDLGPRLENSPAERAALDLVESGLDLPGIRAWRSDFSDAVGDWSSSGIVEGLVPGASRDELVFVAPLGNRAGEDAASGSASIFLALAAARAAAARAEAGEVPPVGLRFVFLGGERRGRPGGGAVEGLGSRTWLARPAEGRRRAVVYLNLDRLPGALELGNAGAGLLSPQWLYERTRASLARSGYDFALQANRMQLHRLGLSDRPGPLASWLRAEIPAVELLDLAPTGAVRAPGEDAEAAALRFDAFVRALAAANAEGFLERWDRHYLGFQVGSASFVIGETAYIGFLLAFSSAVSAGILALTILKRPAAKALLRRVPSIGGELLLLYASAAVAYLSARWLSGAETLLFGSADSWRIAPLSFGASRIAISFCVFLALHSAFVAARLFPPDPYANEVVALAWLGVDVFAFGAIAPALSFYFAWAFAVVAASLALRRPWASIVALVAMYAPVLLLVAEFAARPEAAVLAPLVRPGLGAGLVIAAAAVPFYAFAASPYLFYSRPGRRARLASAGIFAAAALLVWGLLLVRAATVPVADRPPPVLSERIDLDAASWEARLEAPARIGRMSLLRAGEDVVFQSGSGSARAVGAATAPAMELTQRRRVFLDRTTVDLEFRFEVPPSRLEFLLEGREDLRIYDCSLPLRVALDGRSATIHAGVNPGRSFGFSITLPRRYDDSLRLLAGYDEAPVPWSLPGADGAPAGRFLPGTFEVVKSFRLEGGG